MSLKWICISIFILAECLIASCSTAPQPSVSPSTGPLPELSVQKYTPFEDQLNNLIRELGNEDWTKREAATAEIQKIIDYYIDGIAEDPEHPSAEMAYLLKALAYASEKGQPPDITNTQPDLEVQLRAVRLFSSLRSKLNPIGWWRFDDSTKLSVTQNADTTIIIQDISGNNNDATTHSAVYKYDGFYFDGIDDYITTPLVDTLQNFTVEVWAKPLSTTGIIMELVSKRSGNALSEDDFPFALPMDPTGTSVGVAIDSGNDYSWDLSASITPTDSLKETWHHIAATYDSAVLKIYLDGKLAGSKEGVVQLSCNKLPYTIGQAAAEAPAQQHQTGFKGYIREVRIYDYARTPAQIRRDYANSARTK